MRDFMADRQHYIIDRIEPKDGVLKSVHETILGRECQIMRLEAGKRGWVMTEEGDHIFGLNRITLSNVLSFEVEDDLRIHTENTVYHLKRMMLETIKG